MYAAARNLCAHGAAGGRNLPGAVFAYNHDTRYVSRVLALAGAYGQQGAAGTPAAGTAGNSVTHVGIYAGIQDGRPTMVDAPHVGADVRV